MAFLRVTESTTRLALPNKIAKTASTAWDPGTVAIATAGKVAVAASTSELLLGLTTNKVATTDADYADTTPVIVEKIDPNAVYQCPVQTGTLLITMIGEQHDLNSTTGTGIDVTASAHKQVTIVGFIDAATALVKFNPAQI